MPSPDIETHHAAIAAILAMPLSTSAAVFPVIPPQCINTWKLMAERGLYAYDSSPNATPYQREATPTAAIHVDALPVAVVATFVRLRVALCFETRATIRASDL